MTQFGKQKGDGMARELNIHYVEIILTTIFYNVIEQTFHSMSIYLKRNACKLSGSYNTIYNVRQAWTVLHNKNMFQNCWISRSSEQII
jgi:hypothetical protein